MSKTKKIQLARIYRGNYFSGFALAVDGVVLANQKGCQVKTHPIARNIAELQVSFNLTSAEVENCLKIDIKEPNEN